ncbi:hypothetical protein DCS_05446 [Drechmeria coniospora]|uniref:Uncharacterized protein n=1 Tax=Drechmeria coniospora TaxID=98403 RepID=A0A151GN22_DRECN|nr:hypothetical protein DCS_05446 [Drechmeria coniospora]KYK58431.1 hypothetical protein DCS_05446 [Drechmeria coniospora]ODA83920.1 hypothetical protein RJ55_02437 [Drechmeria coniospora]
MASYFHYNAQPAHPTSMSHSHHHAGGRNRRAPRLSVSQNAHRQLRSARGMRDMNETAALSAFRLKFEACRSFDLEDDLEFCPNLLTETDLVSISSASERSSLASNSPESSPTQQPQTVTPGFSLNSSSPAFIPPSYPSHQANVKLHHPSATRGRNAIPIINPVTGISMSSPPPSVSPAAMQALGRRW